MANMVLFDINNIVVKNSKDISEYVSESIRNMYGHVITVQLSRYEGMTSQETVESILKENGVGSDEINPRLPRYMIDLFYTYYNVTGHDKHIVADGASELLKELSGKGVAIGVASGEAERIVKFRLEKVGLDKQFAFGAYGDSFMKMQDIFKAAVSNGVKAGGSQDNVTVIVSTPLQVKAAVGLGFKVIGVAAGGFSTDQLSKAGADLVVKSLREKDKIIKQVLK